MGYARRPRAVWSGNDEPRRDASRRGINRPDHARASTKWATQVYYARTALPATQRPPVLEASARASR